MVTTLVLLVLTTSWNFILGVAGVWNFGQLALYALGGYGAGILMLHTPLPPVVALLGGGVVAAVVAVLLAFPTLRLYGIYTSLLTFAFAEIVQYLIENDGSGLTGGTFGLPAVPGLYGSLSPGAQNKRLLLDEPGRRGGGHRWPWPPSASPRLGIALRTVRDAPGYAAARGVNPLRYRVLAFAVSGFLAGIAGGLYVTAERSIDPRSWA